MKSNILYIGISGILLLNSCSTSLPKEFSENGKEAQIYPDYTSLEVPVNIAPLNFRLDEETEDLVVSLSVEGDAQPVIVKGNDKEVQIPTNEWKKLLSSAVGKNIKYDIYAKKDGKWEHYKPFSNHVNADSIDQYLTYRLIEPSYMGSGEIGIYEFDLENGTEKAIFTNHHDHIKGNNKTQKCVNCHTAQRNHPENKMFYYRGANGGLLLTYNGQLKKINTKCGDMFAGTIYPAWHPSLPFIAFSSNQIVQCFSSIDPEKLQAFDYYSDLVLYDIVKNEISSIRKTKNKQETNPCWSGNGEYLYFNSTDTLFTKHNNPRMMLYNIYRAKFNASNKTWGEDELIFEPAKEGKSATYPRASANGKFLLVTVANYGTSTQTTKSADLYMIDLSNKQVRAMDEINSPTESDSYHDWSSNSKWIVWSSRREDGDYARPFFSHIDENGKGSKPFILPRENSRYHANLIKNYNVTEFSKAKVATPIHEIQDVIESSEIQATYNGTIEKDYIDAYSGASEIKK